MRRSLGVRFKDIESRRFEDAIEQARRRLAAMQQRATRTPEVLEETLTEAFQELQITLEELQVANEEMCQQSEGESVSPLLASQPRWVKIGQEGEGRAEPTSVLGVPTPPGVDLNTAIGVCTERRHAFRPKPEDGAAMRRRAMLKTVGIDACARDTPS
ncbi:MAG TPA: hypothetical protein VNP04_24530 [Alphaproteobacteria bacterium]|nr:hypothetical protein [Alphaproteobacteria bacterium]